MLLRKRFNWTKGEYFALLLFKKTIIAVYLSKHQGWVRFFGKGFLWKHNSMPALFSERYGYRRFIKVLNYRFIGLK